MTAEPVLRRHAGLAEVTGDAHATVLNLPRLEEQQVPYLFEGTAFEIWSRIDGTLTQEQIVDQLVEAYGAPREEIAAGVSEFVARVLELGLVDLV